MSVTTPQQPHEDTEITRPGPKDIPIESIIEYRLKGLSTRDIAALVGCSHVNVVKRLQRHCDDVDLLPMHKKHRADILTLSGKKLLQSVTDGTIKEMSGLQRITAYGILYDKERLERGQSTANVSIHDIDRSLSTAAEEIERLRLELSEMESTGDIEPSS